MSNKGNNNTLYWVRYILMMVVIFSYYVLIEMMYLALFSNLIARDFFTLWVGMTCTNHLVIFNYVNLRKDILEEDLNTNIKMIGLCMLMAPLPFIILLYPSYFKCLFSTFYNDVDWLLDRLTRRV